MSYRVIMPLFNFQSDVKKIELGNGLLIKPISQKKLKAIQRGQIITIIDEMEMKMISCAFETEILGDEGNEVNKVNDLFEKVILSLRLFKSGDVHQKVTFFKRKKGRGTRAFWKMKTIPYVELKPYELAKQEVTDFIKLLNKIKLLKLGNRPDLNIPLYRFNKSYDDPLEEKFIDLMIALESLVLQKGKKEGRSNIKEKVAIGVSMLICKNAKERLVVRTDVEQAYNIRNQIVHGERYRINKDEKELYYIVEDYLRRAIIKMLD